MVNERLPDQMNVAELIEALSTKDPSAVVAFVDTWNSSMVVLHTITEVVEGDGPVVKLRGRDIDTPIEQ